MLRVDLPNGDNVAAEYLAKAAAFDRLAQLAACAPDIAFVCHDLAREYRALAAIMANNAESDDHPAASRRASRLMERLRRLQIR